MITKLLLSFTFVIVFIFVPCVVMIVLNEDNKTRRP